MNDKYFQVKPQPPDELDARSVGLWVAWSKMSNVEIMRETAMKGSTFDLALKFLSRRNHWDMLDAEIWLKNEIHSWALDLLDRNQIHKAIHIFQTNGKNAYEEIMKIFFETECGKLREQLFAHLQKSGKLDRNDLNHWYLFKALENQNYFKIHKEVENLNYIKKQSDNWKFDVGTRIFMDTYDLTIKHFVHPERAWVLLLNEKPELIDYWINIQYHKKIPIRFSDFDRDVLEKLKKVFRKFEINEKMLDLIDDTLPNTKKFVLDELSKFGIYNSDERDDVLKIITRLVNVNKIDNIKSVLSHPNSNVSLKKFSRLLVNYTLSHDIYPVLHEVMKTAINFDDLKEERVDYVNVICSIVSFCDEKNERSLRGGIFEVCKFLSNDGDLTRYFNDNPLMLLACLIFNGDVSLFDALSTNAEVDVDGLKLNGETIMKVLEKFEFFMLIYKKMNGNYYRKSLTHLDLLEKHMNVDVRKLYAHRFVKNVERPHFNNFDLSTRYGYKKEVNYTFFIKNLRPCYAYKIFVGDQSLSDVNQNYITACRKTENFAIKNVLSKEIVSSSITFIELLNGKSYELRVYSNISEIMYKSKLIDKLQILNLFDDVDINCDEIYDILQSAILKNLKITPEMTGEEFIAIINSFDVLIKFSSMHNLKLPEILLKLLAENDLWLEYLIYVQIYNYPLGDVLRTLRHFKTASICEHLEHCFKADIQDDESNVRIGRRYFFSKLGLGRSRENSTSDVSSLSSYGSMTNSVESDILETEILNDETDFLSLIMRCNNSVDPPRAFQFACRYYKRPLLAVFATCYEPDSLLTNWITWLEVSCDVEISNLKYNTIDQDSVHSCFKKVLSEGYFKTLLQSFFIFLHDNPLRYYMEFLNECVVFRFDDDPVIQKLNNFFKRLNMVRRNSFVAELESDMHFTNNKLWIQETALFLTALTLQYGCRTIHDKTIFLKFLCEREFDRYFTVPCPNFRTVLKILEHLFTNSCDTSFDLTAIYKKKKFKQEIVRFIRELLNRNEFGLALSIAEMSGIPTEEIAARQARHMFDVKKGYFWLEIDDIFKRTSFPPESAVEFLCDLSESSHCFEKYSILKVASIWGENFDLRNKHAVEKKLWLSFFEMENCVAHLSLPEDDRLVIYGEYAGKLGEIETFPYVLNETQTANLNATVEALLRFGDVERALKLDRLFGVVDADLEMLKLCFMLAEEIVTPSNLSFEQRYLLSQKRNVKRRMARTSTARVGAPHGSPPSAEAISNIRTERTPDVVSSILDDDTLKTIEELTLNLANGSDVAARVYRCYRSSLNLNKSYFDIVKCRSPLEVLKKALSSSCYNKLEIVGDFIEIFKLSKKEIADLIYEELVDAIILYTRNAIDVCYLWEINVDANFNTILQFLNGDCSLLGTKLFALANATHQSHAASRRKTVQEDFTLAIELMVRAHDCFTADCNMEGISVVLKKCQAAVDDLVATRSWKLLIRLLTGIKRYSEMSYVFPALKDHHQFELLLRRGSRKDAGLRSSLLDYLKKYCPEDVELYKIVALHFFLYSEIAELWEQECVQLIKRLVQVAKLDGGGKAQDDFVYFGNYDDTKRILKKIINNYRHASEYHLNGSKVSKSTKAVEQAQLVALQLSLFKDLAPNESCKCLFQLTKTQIDALLLNEFSFHQALILTKAYNHVIDWASVLYEHCIKRDDAKYLDDYLSNFKLTEFVVNELCRRAIGAPKIEENAIGNMRMIVERIPSVHLKYRVASELGLGGILESLLEGDQLCYLRDTVWKSGYRS